MNCRIAIFASGNGSNAEAIIQKLEGYANMSVVAIYSNNATAYVHERAKNHNISSHVFSKSEFYSSALQQKIIDEDYDLIVLAGFMWLIPAKLVEAYPMRIVNIHPALLPNYGGKGMYGQFVHEAVLKNNESQSGITIHYVNDRYDEGDIILQQSCEVKRNDTPDSLAERIHSLEHKYYPEVVIDLCKKSSAK